MRQAEFVPSDTSFKLNPSLIEYDIDKDKNYLDFVKSALCMVEDTYLSGYGSRGYGQAYSPLHEGLYVHVCTQNGLDPNDRNTKKKLTSAMTRGVMGNFNDDYHKIRKIRNALSHLIADNSPLDFQVERRVAGLAVRRRSDRTNNYRRHEYFLVPSERVEKLDTLQAVKEREPRGGA